MICILLTKNYPTQADLLRLSEDIHSLCPSSLNNPYAFLEHKDEPLSESDRKRLSEGITEALAECSAVFAPDLWEESEWLNLCTDERMPVLMDFPTLWAYLEEPVFN